MYNNSRNDKRKIKRTRNNALRLILKIDQQNDRITNENLRSRAGINTVKARHEELMNRYIETAILSHNPLIIKSFEDFKNFKERNFIKENLALNVDGTTDIVFLARIKEHNIWQLAKKEVHPTALCKIPRIYKTFILDNYNEHIT